DLVGALAERVEDAGSVVASVVGVLGAVRRNESLLVRIGKLGHELGAQRGVAVGIGLADGEAQTLALLERPERVARGERMTLRRLLADQPVALVVGVRHGFAQRVHVSQLAIERIVRMSRLMAQRIALSDETSLQIVELEGGVAELRDRRGLAAEDVDLR